MTPAAPADLPTDAEEPRYRLAYDEAVKVLQQQREDLSALQARALALLSAGTLATAFLGGIRSLGIVRTVVPPDTPGDVITPGLPVWQFLVLVGVFGVLVGLCLVVLWPTGEWDFQFDPTGLVRVLGFLRCQGGHGPEVAMPKTDPQTGDQSDQPAQTPEPQTHFEDPGPRNTTRGQDRDVEKR